MGDWAEGVAQEALTAQGLRLVARNVRCKLGEIDLVMWDGPVLVFIEVRYRRKSGYGAAVESVNAAKQLRIRRAAAWWLMRYVRSALPPCRFDVYALEGTRELWVKAAFTA